MEEYSRLSKQVPDIPDLSSHQEYIETTIDQVLLKQRITILTPMIQSPRYPTGILPSPETLIPVLHTPPISNDSSHVSPQQIQSITTLIEFLHKNVQIFASAVEYRYKQPNKSEFLFLVKSAIPAVFGYFSSQEHISVAFPFYCSLIQTRNQDLTTAALTPFYCSPCTFRFISILYDRFGLKFCLDVRLEKSSIQRSVLTEYINPFIEAIIQTFPLIPQQHQFLLRFMLTSGWSALSVLQFFLNHFVFPQLLRYVKSMPFKNQFKQLKHFAAGLELKTLRPIIDHFENVSHFEVPSCVEILSFHYMKLLITTLDVDIIIRSLMGINELPTWISTFVSGNYFQSIDYIPFYLKVYNRKPLPIRSSINWRHVVFPVYPNHEFDDSENPDFSRFWRELSIKCQELKILPLDLLNYSANENSKLNFLSIKERRFALQFQQFLGPRLNDFKQFVLERSLEVLHNKASQFELYLMLNMAHHDLLNYQTEVNNLYRVEILPYCEETITSILKKYIPQKLALAIRQNHSLIDKILEEGGRVFKSKVCMQLNYMMIIQYILPYIISDQMNIQLKRIENQWQEMTQNIRITIQLPSVFKDKSNATRTLLLNQRLWQAIEHLKTIQRVKFAYVLRIMFEGLQMLSGLMQSDEGEDLIYQHAIAFSDCPLLISRFLIINSLVVKQPRFHKIAHENIDLFIWSKLESAILKLMNNNSELLTNFLSFQDQIILGDFV